MVVRGFNMDGQAWANWFPYEDNQDQKLRPLEDRIYFDPRHNCPGDVIEVQYLGRQQRQFQGKQARLITPSNLRRPAPCPHFGICGGCSFQHLDYPSQCRVKEGMLQECFAQWLESVPLLPLMPAPAELAYRNKMEFTAASRIWQTPEAMGQAGPGPGALGFFVPFSGNKVLDLVGCRLQTDLANELFAWVKHHALRKGWTFYNHQDHGGFFRTLLIRSLEDGQALVMPVFAYDDQTEILACLDEMRRVFPALTSLWYLVNPKLNDSYADLVPVHHSGQAGLVENLDGLEFGIGPQTFFQVNSRQCRLLYDRVLELARIGHDHVVYDLYCGVGTLSCLAARHAAKVVGLEYVESSVALARQYSSRAGLSNTVFYAGDMKDVLNQALYAREGRPDCIILDPPRAGIHPSVAGFLNSNPVDRLVYVSCNMLTLRRDLLALDKTYKLQLIQGVDLMPQTAHVEVIALLVKKESD